MERSAAKEFERDEGESEVQINPTIAQDEEGSPSPIPSPPVMINAFLGENHGPLKHGDDLAHRELARRCRGMAAVHGGAGDAHTPCPSPQLCRRMMGILSWPCERQVGTPPGRPSDDPVLSLEVPFGWSCAAGELWCSFHAGNRAVVGSSHSLPDGCGGLDEFKFQKVFFLTDGSVLEIENGQLRTSESHFEMMVKLTAPYTAKIPIILIDSELDFPGGNLSDKAVGLGNNAGAPHIFKFADSLLGGNHFNTCTPHFPPSTLSKDKNNLSTLEIIRLILDGTVTELCTNGLRDHYKGVHHSSSTYILYWWMIELSRSGSLDARVSDAKSDALPLAAPQEFRRLTLLPGGHRTISAWIIIEDITVWISPCGIQCWAWQSEFGWGVGGVISRTRLSLNLLLPTPIIA